ncbi:MAG: PKD domain-containing protein, partial [Candidatus Cloacimonetes bacterium]|nr:PKD domain-containing protein [Candidatus Cloacimonadota bacterium]
LINSILWNDSPQEIYINTGSVTATYSDIQGGWTGTGNIDSDPLFVDPANGDYHLQEGSICIDAGDPDPQYNDPDGTIADMGAYFFPQFPPEADFTADTINGYVPLMVNFTDLSTQGSVLMDEWLWDFGDGNNSSLQDPANEYLLPGIYTVSLTVTDVNDTTDTETKIDYITVFGNDPPAPPTNVQINVSGDDAIITWAEVDTTIFGDPIDVDYYIVLFSEWTLPDSAFFYLGFTPNTIFTHYGVAYFRDQMFYRIESFVGTRQELDEYVERDLRKPEINYLIK